MMSNTTESIEREVEMKRANVEATLDRLKARTSLDNIAEDIGQYLHIDDARDMLRSAGEQVRRNPVAIGLIAAVIGWLMFGGSSANGASRGSSSSDRMDDDLDTTPYRARSARYGAAADHDAGLTDKVSSAMSEASDTIRSKVGATTENIRSSVGAATDTIAHSSAEVARQAREMTHEVTRQVQGHPLITGALVATLGAVIGAALPKSGAERSLLHAPRRTLLRESKRAAEELGHRASDAAARTVRATRAAAEREGLLPEGDGRTLKEKLSTVAEVAVDEAKANIEPIISGDQTEDDSNDPSQPKKRT